METSVSPSRVVRVASILLWLFCPFAASQERYRIINIQTPSEHTFVSHINNEGQVTGRFFPGALEPIRLFLWSDGVMHDLGDGGGSIFGVAGINDKGQIAGTIEYASGDIHPFLWDGAMHDLGTLGGDFAYSEDINASGQITGTSNLVSGENRAFLWDGSQMLDLGTLGGANSEARALNASGQVTGFAETETGKWRAFLWDGTRMRNLGTIGGTPSGGVAINQSGQVAGGYGDVNVGDFRAFLWDCGLTDLGTLGGDDSFVTAINRRGQIVGDTTDSQRRTHAYLWEDQAMRDLGTIDDGTPYATAMNDSGVVVGNVGFGRKSLAFVSSDGEPMQDLQDLIDPSDPLNSCLRLTTAKTINNRGQIVAAATNRCTDPWTSADLILTPLKYRISTTAPDAGASWRLGASIGIKVALVDTKEAPIDDARAITLANACRVKVSATGAQRMAATCMTYDATANVYYFDWSFVGRGVGLTTLKVSATYKFSMPETITTATTTSISVVE